MLFCLFLFITERIKSCLNEVKSYPWKAHSKHHTKSETLLGMWLNSSRQELSPHQLISNLIPSATLIPPLPCSITYSQIPGISMWMSLGCHYSDYHSALGNTSTQEENMKIRRTIATKISVRITMRDKFALSVYVSGIIFRCRRKQDEV